MDGMDINEIILSNIGKLFTQANELIEIKKNYSKALDLFSQAKNFIKTEAQFSNIDGSKLNDLNSKILNGESICFYELENYEDCIKNDKEVSLHFDLSNNILKIFIL